MDVRELVKALLSGDLLVARQLVVDIQRVRASIQHVARPDGLSERELVVAAAVLEMLAERGRVSPPEWTSSVGALPAMLVLDPGLEQMPRSFARAKADGPEPLRRRNLVALPDFLDVA
jgi:hypothetical protein